MTNDEWIDQQDEHFRNALQRPHNYHELSSEQQWAIDKALGLLDWTGPRDGYEFNRLREHHGLCEGPTSLNFQ
jgi:hypothetical protein